MSESFELHKLTQYIKYQYPNLIYRIDVGADLKLSIGMAKKNKALQMTKRGYPDIFIAKPKVIDGMLIYGLFIELKASGTKIYKDNGELLKNEHLKEQNDMHIRLRKENYYATFIIGFAEAKKIIDWWVK